MAWVYLVLAGGFEILGVTAINRWNMKRNWQSLFLLITGFGASFLFLSLAMGFLPMATAYAVWTGIGAAGGTIMGMLIYGESKDWKRVVFITLIIIAVIGLKWIS